MIIFEMMMVILLPNMNGRRFAGIKVHGDGITLEYSEGGINRASHLIERVKRCGLRAKCTARYYNRSNPF